MSLVVDNSADYIRRTANLPSPTSFTLAGWVKHVADVIDWETLLSINSAVDEFVSFSLQETNSWTLRKTVGNDVSGTGPSLDTWYYTAMTCAGTGAGQLIARVWNAAGTLLDTRTLAGDSITLSAVCVMTNQYGQYFNGKVAYGRLWDAVLSQSELEAELASATIVRTSNINTAFGANDATDVSGNGRDWATSGVTVDSGDNPSFGPQIEYFRTEFET